MTATSVLVGRSTSSAAVTTPDACTAMAASGGSVRFLARPSAVLVETAAAGGMLAVLSVPPALSLHAWLGAEFDAAWSGDDDGNDL